MLVLEKLLVSFEHLTHSAREIIAPDGSDAWAPAKPRPDETLIRALARADDARTVDNVERVG